MFFPLLLFTNQSSSSQVLLFLGWGFPLPSLFFPLPHKKYDYNYIFAFIIRIFDNYFVPFTFLTFSKYIHLLKVSQSVILFFKDLFIYGGGEQRDSQAPRMESYTRLDLRPRSHPEFKTQDHNQESYVQLTAPPRHPKKYDVFGAHHTLLTFTTTIQLYEVFTCNSLSTLPILWTLSISRKILIFVEDKKQKQKQNKKLTFAET